MRCAGRRRRSGGQGFSMDRGCATVTAHGRSVLLGTTGAIAAGRLDRLADAVGRNLGDFARGYTSGAATVPSPTEDLKRAVLRLEGQARHAPSPRRGEHPAWMVGDVGHRDGYRQATTVEGET
jgi:hypothetical protein